MRYCGVKSNKHVFSICKMRCFKLSRIKLETKHSNRHISNPNAFIFFFSARVLRRRVRAVRWRRRRNGGQQIRQAIGADHGHRGQVSRPTYGRFHLFRVTKKNRGYTGDSLLGCGCKDDEEHAFRKKLLI